MTLSRSSPLTRPAGIAPRPFVTIVCDGGRVEAGAGELRADAAGVVAVVQVAAGAVGREDRLARGDVAVGLGLRHRRVVGARRRARARSPPGAVIGLALGVGLERAVDDRGRVGRRLRVLLAAARRSPASRPSAAMSDNERKGHPRPAHHLTPGSFARRRAGSYARATPRNNARRTIQGHSAHPREGPRLPWPHGDPRRSTATRPSSAPGAFVHEAAEVIGRVAARRAGARCGRAP